MDTKEWLRFFLDEGCSCIPLKKNDKKPAIKWKKYCEEKLPEAQIEEILAKEASINYGVICGEISNNLLIIDIDNAELFEMLSLGELASHTLTIRTAKGYHIYLKIDDPALKEWISGSGVKILYYPLKRKGLEEESKEEIRFQWNEHYVVGPNSIHPSGVRYEHFLTSPKKIVKAKSIGLLDEIVRRWESYRKIYDKKTIIKEPLFEFIKRYIKPEGVTDYGDHIKIRCPFHKDNIPSFAIYKDNHFYCYGCEVGGKHVEFLMHLKGLSRDDALEELGLKKKRRGEEEKKYATTVIDDGKIVEEVLRDGIEQFVIFDRGTGIWDYAHNIINGGETIYPLPLLENQKDALIIPDGVEEYGSIQALRKEMCEFALQEFDPVENRELFVLIMHLFLTSWIASLRMQNMAERFIPIIVVRGPSETGKKRFLTIARWLTYHSLYALKTTKVPTLFRSLNKWGGTLVLDEADLADTSEKSEFIEFMNSRADGVPIPRYNSSTKEVEFFQSFGMSVIAERSASADDGYESRKIIFPSDATPTPEKYSLIPGKEWVEKGKALQRKLLLFRLRHLDGEVPTNLIIEGISGFRVRESLLLLQSLVAEDNEITANIKQLAKKLEERIIIERSGSMEGLIMNYIYNALVDPTATIIQYRNGLEIQREYGSKNPEDGTHLVPITLKTISKSLGDVISPSEVARRWRGLGQGVRSRGRVSGKLYAGIIQITNTKRFIKEVNKYVVDVDKDELKDLIERQKTFEEVESGDKISETEPKNSKEEIKIGVRILEDLPTFMGTDQEIYELKKGQVVKLPKTNAESLIKRNVAIELIKNKKVAKSLRDIIKELEKEYGPEVPIEEVLDLAEYDGMDREKVEEMIELMERDGILYSPMNGVIKFVRCEKWIRRR